MSEDPRVKHLSPFGLAPSAYPPPAPSKPAPVVVPSAGRTSSVPAPPLSSELSVDPAIPLLAPPVLLPFEAPLPTSSRRRPATTVLVASAVLAVVLLGLATWVLLPRLRAARPTGSAVVVAPAASPSTTPSAEAPASTASAAPPASVAADAPPQPPPSTKPFDRQAARAALDALAPTLTGCKIPRGKSGRIKLAFGSDGTVLSAKPLPPLAGTPRGVCVAGHLKQAKVPPFSGSAPPYVYSFVVPR